MVQKKALDGRQRTKVESEATRARILDAARGLFEEKGSVGLSMRVIAARAEMPTATVYGYFPGKTAIIRGLWSLAFDPLFARLRAEEQKHVDPKVRLGAVAKAYVEYWIHYPDSYRMVFLIEDVKDHKDGSWFISQTDVVVSYLHFGSLIANARGEPESSCQAEAEALICVLNGIVHMAVTVSEYPWAPPTRYLDIIFEGFY